MRVSLERTSTVPLYLQLAQYLSEEIRSGALSPGLKLPSIRQLAAQLGVSRIVVDNAYAELESVGLVFSRRGSGTYVLSKPESRGQSEEDFISARDWPLWQQVVLSRTWHASHQELLDLLASVHHSQLVSFAEGALGDELWPVVNFRKALQAVIKRDGAVSVGQSYDAAGYMPLRTTVSEILNSEGIPARPENVLITSGSQQALSLVARLLLSPGDVVLVESPTYNVAIDLFRSMDVRLLGIPIDENGMRTELVEAALRTASPRLIFTIPTFHNPTGTCMSGERRRHLIDLATRYNVPILEDDFVGNLRYNGRSEPALKALDPGGRVIYIATFSKLLMPGLRLGFLVADGPVFAPLRACKYTTDLNTSELLQRALQHYIDVGRYRAHLRRVCLTNRRRRDVMLAALSRYLPADTQWLSPKGGRYIWMQLPAGLSANELFPLAAEEGVTYVPGSFFFPGERPKSHLRLNFAINPEAIIEEGVRRLGRAVRRLIELTGASVDERR